MAHTGNGGHKIKDTDTDVYRHRHGSYEYGGHETKDTDQDTNMDIDMVTDNVQRKLWRTQIKNYTIKEHKYGYGHTDNDGTRKEYKYIAAQWTQNKYEQKKHDGDTEFQK